MNILSRPYYGIEMPGLEFLIGIPIINHLNYRILLYLGFYFYPNPISITYNVRNEYRNLLTLKCDLKKSLNLLLFHTLRTVYFTKLKATM